MEPGATAVVALALLVVGGALLTAGVPAATGPERATPALATVAAGHLVPAVMDPAAAGATGKLLVSTPDPLALPNSGLRTNITVYSADTLPADTSFQISATETIGGFDAVFGVFENTRTFPVAFFYVFNNSTDAPVLTENWSSLPLIDGLSYDFELVSVNSTAWELTVNGEEFGANDSLAHFDFGASQATWAGGLLFSEIAFYGSVTPVPAVVNVPLTLAVRGASGWYLPMSASTSFAGSGGSPWGVEGRAQHPTLAPGEIDSGTSVAPLPNGTGLWSGGVAPVRVGVSLSGSSGVGTTPLFVTLTVDDTVGAPIPGVSLALGDALGGSSLVQPLVTDGTGTVEGAIELPNVSVAASDLISATVTLFGYEGTAGAAVDVLPALQVFLAAPDLPGTIAPGAQFTFTMRAADASGGTVAGATLVVTTPTVGGQVSPTEGVTGPNGTFQAQLLAPTVPTVMTLLVNVTGGGAWGHATFTVNVATAPPSFWALHGAQVELGASIVVAGTGGRGAGPVPHDTAPSPVCPSRTRSDGATVRWGRTDREERSRPLPVRRLQEVLLEPAEALVPEVEVPGPRFLPVGAGAPAEVLESDVDPFGALLEPEVDVGLRLGLVEERGEGRRGEPGEIQVHVRGHLGDVTGARELRLVVEVKRIRATDLRLHLGAITEPLTQLGRVREPAVDHGDGEGHRHLDEDRIELLVGHAAATRRPLQKG